MRRKSILVVASLCLLGCRLLAQENGAPKRPEVRINYLNVCTPDAAAQAEISAALGTIPLKPSLAADFEVSRGRATVTQGSALESAGGEAGKPTIANFVRIRHDLTPGGIYGNVQYTFSVDENGMSEILVLHARDLSKGVIQISFQDSVSAGTPAAVLAANTPVDRIRVERSGKSSLVLARCASVDQQKYDNLFRTGSEILARYRSLLHVGRNVPADLARLQDRRGTPSRPKPSHK